MTNRPKRVKPAEESEQKPFELVKFFSFSALAVFLVFTFVLVWLISDNTKELLLQRSEAYALVLAENLNHQVYQQFVVPTYLRYNEIALRKPEQFQRLDTIIRNTTHGLNINSVTIYENKSPKVAYSTIAEKVGQLEEETAEYKKARGGENISTLSIQGSLLSLFPGRQGVHGQLQTFIPFRLEQGLGQDTGPILGVFEIVQDLSSDLEGVVRLQGVILGTSIIMMSGLFIALWLIVSRGDKIVARRTRERLKMEEQLNHVERLAGLGKMVAAVSHEIKNPLGIIRSTAEVLGKRMTKLAPGNEHLSNIIVQETRRLDRIVTEFLDFARPQKMRIGEVVLGELLNRALAFMAPEFTKGNITVVQKVDNTATAAADSDHLYQAILNILVNAVQAMPDGGTLTVHLFQEVRTRSVCLEIADTGIGMSEEVLGQIFTPFFTRKNRGTGLGLAIVKNIIESQLGQIDVDSTEGQGTLFTIRLPQTND
ncbi:MAG: ATP-binding protein [Desulfobulbaceae bacterium]|nr:ATP-binding protein [Desulfobulbaceae bacterium]